MRLKTLFETTKGLFNTFFIIVHTIFWCFFMYILFFFKILSSNPKWRNPINAWLIRTANCWIASNNFMMALTLNVKWELPNFDHLSLKQWYFIISNHQSWTDILVLQKIFLGKIPFIRFFIKKELFALPVLNLAWWAYDFPIMHRYSKEKLERHPELRGKDLLATQKACDVYKNTPVTILNFLEGTRFTPSKHHKQNSPYENLLIPKTGGFAFAVNAMDKKITHILDVTIIYPEGRKTFWDFLCGRVHHIVVKLQEREIPESLLKGDYSNNTEYREHFKNWITTFWQEKDQLLRSFLKSKFQAI
jgi:1-acyl-sn-glycerol-3-phosphate acyltransferase